MNVLHQKFTITIARISCFVSFAVALLVSSPLSAQDATYNTKIKSDQLGLPAGTARNSEPFVVRIYKKDASDNIILPQPQGYPFSITSDYVLKDDEKARPHQGIDFSSKLAANPNPTPLDFKAGIYGTVVKAGDGPWGTITVQIHDGSLIQYLHTTAAHVKVGDIVAPDTVLGVTGRTGAGIIHLHIQAKDKNGNAISPDLAFQIGQNKLLSKEKPAKELIEFDPDAYSPVQPKVIGRQISAVVEPESKWVVEIIGGGGNVDLVLGEFFDYQSASHCALAWSEAHPGDLRLTREREVQLKDQKSGNVQPQ